MAEWVRALLDVVLICMVGAGLIQAARLIKHLAILKQSRMDMEKFVHEFNATVIRAEAGIKGLRNAARESGDDLEKLVEKAYLVRDELNYIVESADQIAERLSQTATNVVRPENKPPAVARNEAKPATAPMPAAATGAALSANKNESAMPASRAEKELLQALQKLS